MQPSNVLPKSPGIAAIGDSTLYARADHVHPHDDAKLDKSGGTMTGSLILKSDPTEDLEATTKQYVDNHTSDVVLYTSQTLTNDQKTQARGNIGAAPAGFGLGEASKIFTDANDCVTNGWYCDASGTAANTPFKWCHILVSTFMGGGTYVRQDAYITGETNIATHHMVRFKHPDITDNNGWGVWEWEQGMDMYLGIEYRTTERYLGKPVYVFTFNYGTLPASGDKIVFAPVAANILDIIAYGGYTSGGEALPFLYPTSNGTSVSVYDIRCAAFKNVNGGIAVDIGVSKDRSNETAIIWAKYTKTTD